MFELIANIADRVKIAFPELEKVQGIGRRDQDGRVLQQIGEMNEFKPSGLDDRNCDYFYIRHRETGQFTYEQTDEGRVATCERVKRVSGQFSLVIVTKKVNAYEFEDIATRALIGLDQNDTADKRNIDIDILESEIDSRTVAIRETPGDTVKDFDPKFNFYFVDFDLVFLKVELIVPGSTNSGVRENYEELSMLFGGGDERLVRPNNLNNDNLGTFSIWVNPVALAVENAIFGIGGDNVPGAGTLRFQIGQPIAGQFRFQIVHSAEFLATTNRVSAQSTLIDVDEWVNLIMTTTGSAWKSWVNATPQSMIVLEGNNNGDWFDTHDIGNPEAVFGMKKFEGAYSSPLNGYLAEGTYYNKTFDDDDATELFGPGIPKNPKTYSFKGNLKNHWRFTANPFDNYDVEVPNEWKIYDGEAGFNMDSVNMDGDESSTNFPS